MPSSSPSPTTTMSSRSSLQWRQLVPDIDSNNSGKLQIETSVGTRAFPNVSMVVVMALERLYPTEICFQAICWWIWSWDFANGRDLYCASWSLPHAMVFITYCPASRCVVGKPYVAISVEGVLYQHIYIAQKLLIALFARSRMMFLDDGGRWRTWRRKRMRDDNFFNCLLFKINLDVSKWNNH